ncbi:hypothetical protein WQ54_28220 [Bacillus sp. SA1-12]|uniref:Na-translocating system protein MpsC family protein n=1 Tax=Bacillus sp. SA1-12 TaxID=1455638 RepID=UPI00062746A8|nr:Na-translocating system protein MpsC family protein [Bacillus sp. SA1-12]KKI89110.1 hypothetical protein WQ54_28220 [Bacillus sp. SA1-12]
MPIQEQLNYISGYTSKLLRKKFGRGPQSCQSIANKWHLVIVIRGFLSPMEEVLLSKGQNNLIDLTRTTIISSVLEELKGVIQVTLEAEIEGCYHDWNLSTNSGLLMFTLNNPVVDMNEVIQLDANGIKAEVSRVSSLVQKVPEHIELYPLSSQIFLVERKGILIPIERALIMKGFIQELRMTKDELEKRYFYNEGKFEELFNINIKEIFIDWNLKDDRSLMAFIIDNR